VHPPEKGSRSGVEKEKSAQKSKNDFRRFGTMSKPTGAIFFTSYFGLLLYANLGSSLCQGARGARSPEPVLLSFSRQKFRHRSRFIDRVIDRVASIPSPKFRSPNLRVDFHWRWRACFDALAREVCLVGRF
jgi:hypothetical protein